MERKDLKAQGLTEEQITAVLELHHAELTPVKEKLKTAEDDLKVAQDKVKGLTLRRLMTDILMQYSKSRGAQMEVIFRIRYGKTRQNL